MRRSSGVEVEHVLPGSPAAAAGIMKGDFLLSVNRRKVNDIIDYMFYANDPELHLALTRGGKKFTVTLGTDEAQDPGLVLKHFKVRTCKNKCIFCFVAQLPKGLRKALYVRDEDYRMSFLYGNYVTLTGLTAADRKRIAEQRLSPLYISVHATDRALRNSMLGNPRAPDIMKDLRYLKAHKIRMHTQIVLCPGLNDGEALKKTVRDLYSLYPYVSSIAVVPVGLTYIGMKKVRALEQDDALEALATVEGFQKRFRKRHGEPIVHAADELYIRASRPLPPLKAFGELPQIENGVGMVPSFVSRAQRMRLDIAPSPKKFLAFTGTSFYPFLERFIERLRNKGLKITLKAVKNALFGPSVTVTGLLTGRDVIKSLSTAAEGHDVLFIPGVVLKAGEDVFLDDVTVADVEKALDIEARVVEPSPDGLLEGLKS